MSKLSVASIATLEREIARKRARLEKLNADRAAIMAKLGVIDKEIALLAGAQAEAPAPAAPEAPVRKRGKKSKKKAKKTRAAAPKTRGRRPKLADAIRAILTEAKAPMKAAQISDALRERKFKTKSKDLPNLVRETLSRIPEAVRVSRGLYTIK